MEFIYDFITLVSGVILVRFWYRFGLGRCKGDPVFLPWESGELIYPAVQRLSKRRAPRRTAGSFQRNLLLPMYRIPWVHARAFTYLPLASPRFHRFSIIHQCIKPTAPFANRPGRRIPDIIMDSGLTCLRGISLDLSIAQQTETADANTIADRISSPHIIFSLPQPFKRRLFPLKYKLRRKFGPAFNIKFQISFL